MAKHPLSKALVKWDSGNLRSQGAFEMSNLLYQNLGRPFRGIGRSSR